MKQRLHDFPRKLQHPLLLATGLLPLAVFFLSAWFPLDERYVFFMTLFFTGTYLLLAWASLLVSGGLRFVIGGAGIVLLMGLSCWLMPIREKFYVLFIPLLYSAMLWLSLPMGGWHRDEELSAMWYIFFTILHVLVQLLLHDLPLPSALMLVSFLIFLLLAMLSLNRTSLNSAGHYRVRVPEHMRRRNIILTVALFLLTLLIAALPAIGAFLRRLWDGFIGLIFRIVNWFSSLFAADVAGGGGGGASDLTASLGVLETPEPSLFQIILEKILFGLAFVAGIALVIWMGYELWQKIRRLAKWLWQRMEAFSASVTKDYEDEVTDTRDEAQYEKISPFQRLRQRLARVDESKLSPAQRIRYRYMRLRMKHEEWQPADTVRDTLPEEAAQLYERARYGNQSMSEEEARQFRDIARRI